MSSIVQEQVVKPTVVTTALENDQNDNVDNGAIDVRTPGVSTPSKQANYDELGTPKSVNEKNVGNEQHQAVEVTPEEPTKSNEDEGEEADNLMHGLNSFWAIITPVMVTMLIASFVVVHYRSQSLQQSMSSYLVFEESSEESSGAIFGQSLVNALVIIGFVALLTFAMVLLYKYNCMKFLVGYIMFASAAILGFQGGQLMDAIIIDQFHWPVDWPSFIFILYNFGIVGVIAIFYQKGVSGFFVGAYLVLVSVTLAWQFSMWSEWTTWMFCSMFAIYDLCAVLTPCGPLKCLIGLIQEKQQPMPGLLYEATVTDGVQNEEDRQRKAEDRRKKQELARASSRETEPSGTETEENNETMKDPTPVHEVDIAILEEKDSMYPEVCETLEEFTKVLQQFYEQYSPENVYKVESASKRFFDKQEQVWPLLYHKYKACSCTNGVPCQAKIEANMRARQREEEDEDKTIKLGLGDFIFYSVLVGRAALYDFSTMAACFLCVIMGLGGTLFLLAVLHKALPALPFSIFLATIYYFWTRAVFVDFADFLYEVPVGI